MPEPSSATAPQFQRSMQVRHLVMLSLGGVIGTGLFFTLGTSLPAPARWARYWRI